MKYICQIDVASAMEYLHSLRPCIIHRDLKSLNVLRSKQGSLKICDFGLVTTRNTQAGTPAYMAPELILNQTFNKSVDVFSFGILLCEMYSRVVPFVGVDSFEIRERIVAGERPVISYSCPQKCAKLIKQCW